MALDIRPGPAPRSNLDIQQGASGKAANKVDLMDVLLGTSPKKLSESGHWIQGGLLQSYKDLYSIPANFANQATLNQLKYNLEKTGYTLPFEAESGMGQVLAHGAGVAGAIASPANKILGLRILKPVAGVAKNANLLQKAGSSAINIAKNAAAGGLLGGMYASDAPYAERFTSGAMLGGAIPATAGTAWRAAKSIPAVGRMTARSLGGISDLAVEMGRKIGWKKVFDPVKSAAGYLSENIIPRVRQKFIQSFSSIDNSPRTKQMLTNMGFGVDEINRLVTLNKNSIKFITEQVRKGLKPSEAIDLFDKHTDEVYAQFIKANPNARINVKGTYLLAKKALMKNSWMDENGQLMATSLLGQGGIDPTQSMLYKLYTNLQPGKGGIKARIPATTIDGATYLNYLDELGRAMKNDPTKMRVIIPIRDSLRRKAERAIPGLKPLNKLWTDKYTLLDFAKRFDNSYSDEGIITSLRKLNPNSTMFNKYVHERAQAVLGKDVYDDVMSNYLQGIFAAKGFPSRAGARAIAIKKLAKSYYQHVEPALQNLPNTAPVKAVMSKLDQYRQSAQRNTDTVNKFLQKAKVGLSIEDVSNNPKSKQLLEYYQAQKNTEPYLNDKSYKAFIDRKIAVLKGLMKGGGPSGQPFRR